MTKSDAKIFKFKSHTLEYRLTLSYNRCAFMQCVTHGNDFIWTLLLSEIVPTCILELDKKYNLLVTHWASTIVGYKITDGAWPTTKCEEDCINLCNELDRVIAMKTKERKKYLTEIITPVLPQLVIQDF